MNDRFESRKLTPPPSYAKRWFGVGSPRFRQVLRFGIVGVVQNGVSLIVLTAAMRLGLAPWQAFAIVFPMAVCATYWLNSRWTFQERRQRRAAPYAYALVYCSAYVVSLALSYGLEGAGLHDVLNAILTIGATGVYTFLALDRGVFG